MIRLAAYCSTARNALAALTRLKSGFHLAELAMRSPVLALTNFLSWGTRDRYSATRPRMGRSGDSYGIMIM